MFLKTLFQFWGVGRKKRRKLTFTLGEKMDKIMRDMMRPRVEVDILVSVSLVGACYGE